jgi:hypothetical protein
MSNLSLKTVFHSAQIHQAGVSCREIPKGASASFAVLLYASDVALSI